MRLVPLVHGVLLVTLLPEVPEDVSGQEVGLCFTRLWNRKKTKPTFTGLAQGRVLGRELSRISGRCHKICGIS